MKSLNITRLQELNYTSNEAMNTLCTNLSFVGDDIKKIMITSCRPQEGKSYLTINLMRSMANLGKSVILVDADLRKSIMVGRYGVISDQNIMGLSHYLAGMCSISDILYKTDIPNAFMILAGQDVVNSLPLLNNGRLGELLNELAGYYDMVLIDTPPVGVLIDSAQIAKYCDGVVFVVTTDEINRRELKEAKEQIEKTECPILGAVLNKVDINTRSAKRYYNKSYYSHYEPKSDPSNEVSYLHGKENRKKKEA